jgi:hypothetical protein
MDKIWADKIFGTKISAVFSDENFSSVSYFPHTLQEKYVSTS